MTIEATDKSKLAARAGGLSVSKGSSVGMGIASTTVVSSNDVTANVGDGVTINAKSFKLNAEKLAVTDADFKQLIDMRYLVTDSSELNDEQREKAKTGLIDLHKGEDDNYKVEVNLSEEKLLDAVDALNFLSSQNTYAEAIAGSMATGKTKASIAGSFAVAVTSNHVKAGLGDGVNVTARRGDADVAAADGATTRVIAGSLSAAPAKAAVGATVAVLVNGDVAEAITGNHVNVNASGDVKHQAEQTGDAQVFTAAMAVAAGADAKAAAGGAINVIVNKSVANNIVGNDAVIAAKGNADIGSRAKYDLMLISGSANVSAGANAKVAAGGTINVIVDSTRATTTLGNSNTVTAGKDLSITSDVSDQMISGAVSASAALSATGRSGAGSVNVIVSKSVANTAVGDTAKLTATAGDLALKANNDAWMLNATLAAAGSAGAAIGGSFNVNVFNRAADVVMSDGTLTAGGNLSAQSSGRDTTILAGLALAGSVTGAAVSGNVGVLVENNDIHTNITKGVTARAGKSALLEAYFSDFTVGAAGSIALSGSSAAVGATALTVVKNNDVRTSLGESAITAAGEDVVKSLSGEEANGIYVGANARETQFLGAAGVAAAGSAAVNGVVDVLVNNNTVVADASRAALNSESEDWRFSRIYFEYITPTTKKGYYWYKTASMATFMDYVKRLQEGSLTSLKYRVDGRLYDVNVNDLSFPKLKKRGGIAVKAADDTKQILLAGGVSASASAGVGASVVTLVSNKDVKALAHDMKAGGDVSVGADNKDDITQVAVNAGLAGSAAVQIGAAVQVLKSKAAAEVGSEVSARDGKVDIQANNDTKLLNAAGAVAGAGGAAVTPVGVVTYFSGEARALLMKGSTVKAATDVNIHARSSKEIDLYSAGFAVGGGAGVSGTANVMVSKDKTRAAAEQNTSVTAAGMNVEANSDYKLTSATGVLAGGTAGVGVNAVVSVLKSNTTAEVAGRANLSGDLKVTASGKRSVTNLGANLSAGAVGVGVNVMVLVAGTKMSQDAADMLTYGNASSKTNANKTFDPDKFLGAKGVSGTYKEYEKDANGNYALDGNGNRKVKTSDTLKASELTADVAGNGHYESKQSVGSTGTKDGKKQGTFDASSGYRSGDFDNKNYSDSGETQRGENLKAKDTTDVANAKKVNTYTYTGDPEDAVIARITDTAVIEKARDVAVSASQPVTADLFGATVGAGAVGVGVTAAVAMLRSNVLASAGGEIQTASGNVSVTAESKSGGSVANRSSDLKKLLKNLDPAAGGIRVIGATASAGAVGVAVAAGVVLTDNMTQATLGGKIGSAKNVTVDAKQEYGHITGAVGALSAGAIAVGASVSVVQSNGTVNAKILDKANITASGDVKVTGTGNQKATSVAVTAGAGAIAANAGVALAINRMKQNTGIGSGAVVNAKNITVKGASETAADSGLIGVSVGAGAVALGAAVSQVNAELDTYADNATLKAAGGTVEVSNDVVSSATPNVLSFAGGGLAAGGNVLLAFNETKSRARVSGGSVEAGTLIVAANLQGSVTSKLEAAQAGGIAVGLSVNYADMQALNRAVVERAKVNVDTLLVQTGRSSHDNSNAVAQTITGGMGFASISLNAAIARNKTRNYAVVDGGEITVKKNVQIRAHDLAKAEASAQGVQAAGLKIAANTVVALNDADTRTSVKTDKLQADGVTVKFEVYQRANTDANIQTGGGAVFEGTANVGVAYGRSSGVIDVNVKKLTAGNVNAVNDTSSATNTKITNGAYAAVKATAMVGAAFGQGVYDTKVTMGDGSNVTGNMTLTTDYGDRVKADVTPHKGGLDASLLKLTVNLAAARNTSYAGADLAVSSGTAKVGNHATVKSIGTGTATATINPVKIEVSGVKVAANFANADMSLRNAATIHLNEGTLNLGNNAYVQAISRQAEASASLGNAGSSGASISLANLTESRAYARENMSITAAVIGAEKTEKLTELYYDVWHDRYGYMGRYPEKVAEETWRSGSTYLDPVWLEVGTKKVAKGNLNANGLVVEAVMEKSSGKSNAKASTNGAQNVSFLTLGNLTSSSTAKDSFSTMLRGVNVNVDGDVIMTARVRAASSAVGAAPGGYQMISGGVSNTYGYIGTSGDRQSVQALIGEGVKIKAGRNVTILAENNAEATSSFAKRGGYSLAQVNSSSQPTRSWVDTSLVVGAQAEINAQGALSMTAQSNMTNKSEVNSSSTGLLLNVATMKGYNEVSENISLLIGSRAKLNSGADMLIKAGSKANLRTRSDYAGSWSLIGGQRAESYNKATRTMEVSMADDMTATAGGKLEVTADLGTGDDIYSNAEEEVRAALEFAKSYAEVNGVYRNKINLGAVELTAGKGLNITAMMGGSIKADGSVDAAENFKIDAAPTGESYIEMVLDNGININRSRGTTSDASAKLISREGGVNIKSKMESLKITADNYVEGSGLLGGVDAYDTIKLNMEPFIWIDGSILNGGSGGVNLRANYGENGNAQVTAKANSALYGVGYEGSHVKVTGRGDARIYTTWEPKIYFGVVQASGTFTHVASTNWYTSRQTLCTGWGTSIGKRKDESNHTWTAFCAFCSNVGSNWGQFDYGFGSIDTRLASLFEKALAPVNDISRMVNDLGYVVKARYGEEDDKAAEAIYVLDVEAPLTKDVTFGKDRLAKYRLWTNAQTQHGVDMLPNATRLYSAPSLDYVSEVIRGDVRGDGGAYNIDIFTALNANAFRHPVIPIGASGMLDFATGTFTLPASSDFELYLHEVSGQWLLNELEKGFIRRMDADQDAINTYVLDDDSKQTLPTGPIIEGLAPDGEAEGRKRYWLGDTPETAADDGQVLVYLLHDEATDELDAFRTSRAMLDAGERPVDVSLYLFRDSKSDRMGEEKYNALFFDTPEGEKSLVKVMTDVLEGRDLEVPKSLRIVLRGFDLGADLPAYSLTDHFFAMNDGTDGKVSMFDGFYEATFDGDIFDSDYTRIEGILNNDLTVTVKQGQSIWPEWTGKDAAEDIGGESYKRLDGVWYNENGTLPPEDDVAA